MTIYPNIIIIGCSAGGLKMLLTMLKPLSTSFPYPIIIVQHLALDGEVLLMEVLEKSITLPVHEAIAEETPLAGHVYVAPGDYHLLIERDGTFNLSLDEKVIGSRPSIDVLMESALDAYGKKLIAFLLTGNSKDGANAIKKTVKEGATAFIQDPTSADYPVMPLSAIAYVKEENVLKPDELANKLIEMDQV